MTIHYRHDKDLTCWRRSTQTICTASVWTCHQTRRRKSTVVMWWTTRTGRTENEASIESIPYFTKSGWSLYSLQSCCSQRTGLELWKISAADVMGAAAPPPKPTPTSHPHQDRNYNRDFVDTSGFTWTTLRPKSAIEIWRLVGIFWNI